MKNIVMIILFTLLQGMLLCNMQLFGVVTPLFCVYYVIMLRRDLKHWYRMVTAFAIGLGIDMLENTPGMSTAAMTLIAFIQPYILELYMKNEDAAAFEPSIANMGFVKYFSYALLLTFIFAFTYFTLEAFSFFNFAVWLESIFGSLLLTLMIILSIDSIRR